jgi:hypothetical protein
MSKEIKSRLLIVTKDNIVSDLKKILNRIRNEKIAMKTVDWL